MGFACLKCGKVIDKEELGKKTRCPYCGGKLLFKERPKIIKKIKAV